MSRTYEQCERNRTETTDYEIKKHNNKHNLRKQITGMFLNQVLNIDLHLL